MSNCSIDLSCPHQCCDFEGSCLLDAAKTELCKTYSLMGSCPYGRKCRFAHGKGELVRLPGQERRKHMMCKSFWRDGICRYGIRCQFGHASL